LEQFYNQRFPNSNPAIVYGIFFGCQVHRCKKAILMPFFATMSGSIGNREPSAVAAETNWRRSSAALPQIKNGRADLPVSPNMRLLNCQFQPV
jgi:hypothetical protein